jgi:hypothetical protein
MRKHCYYLFIGCLFALRAAAQPAFTANDQVMPYTQPFRYGANLGNYPPWTNQQLANVIAGNAAQNLPGVGVNAFRGALPEHFLETWGYNIRLPDYQHFNSLGVKENLAFTGYPGEAHRDPAVFCDTVRSALFENMYEPIWDGGANGTPVNDQNYYALYLWKMVNVYKPFIRFWEVWNEPDFTYNTAVAFAPPGAPGNWWENNPNPCDYALMAPVFHYVRLLRISWEVIKTADPTAYICIGGIGNPAFLDAVLRNSDNPSDGSVAATYPLKGGAYFDVLSFHSYPHLDGSMWEFPPTGGLFFHRHSDRGVEGMLARLNNLTNVLATHGYDGTTYPKKLRLLSETNIPRKPFNVYIGSDEAQVNYMLKVLTEAHRHGLEQLYVFNVADLSNEPAAWNEFLLMGLVKNLSDYTYPGYEENDVALAWQTAKHFFTGRQYDAALTAALGLPGEANGAAFLSDQDTVFVLWAKTTLDSSETASASYSFPADFQLDTLYQWAWDYVASNDTALVKSTAVNLTGTPVFFAKKPPYVPEDTMVIETVQERLPGIEAGVFPNPSAGDMQVQLHLQHAETVSLTLLNALAQPVDKVLIKELLPAGPHVFELRQNLPAGIYWLEVQAAGKGSVFLPVGKR